MPERFRLPFDLDIHTAVQTTLIILGVLIVLFVWRGILSIRNARRLRFFRMRRERMMRGWRLIITALILIPVAYLLNRRVEPLIYTYSPPTATVTPRPAPATETSTSTPTESPRRGDCGRKKSAA